MGFEHFWFMWGKNQCTYANIFKRSKFQWSDTQSEDTLGNFLLHCFPPTFFCKVRNVIPLLLITFGSWSCGCCLVNYLIFEQDNFVVSEITVFSLKICDHDLAMIVMPTKMIQFNLKKCLFYKHLTSHISLYFMFLLVLRHVEEIWPLQEWKQ